MASTISSFDQIASRISARASELLKSDVAVVDEDGRIIAGSGGFSAEGYLLRSTSCEYARTPLRFDGRRGEVVIAKPDGQETGAGDFAQVLLDIVIHHIAAVDDTSTTPQIKDRFIHRLLRGAVDDEESILREAQILGMDLAQPRAVILIDAADFIRSGCSSNSAPEAKARARAERVISSVVGFFTLPDDNICGYIGQGELVVLKASSTRDLTPWSPEAPHEDDPGYTWANLSALRRACNGLLHRLQRDTGETITIGVGRYHPDINGISRSYQDARAALSLGRHFHGEDRVHCLNDIGLAALVGLSDDNTKVELANYLLSPLNNQTDLIKTIEVFFTEDCCPTATAQRLGIHRNTVSYRLHKVNSLIGLDPTSFEDAVQIRIALLLQSFHAR